MSKPTTPGELRDVKIDTISLVSKAANKKTFKIFKSAGNESVDAPPEQAPATVSKDERGLFDVLKSYFSGGDVQKGEVADKFNAAEKSRRFYELTDALQSSIGYSRYGDSKKTEPDSKKIKEALSDFHRIAGEILLGSDGDIKKFGEEVQKSGRKISGARLSELKAAHAALSKIIDEADETPDSEGDVNVVKEELEKLIKNCVDEAVKPLSVKLEKLEKLERVEKEEDKAEPGASVEKGADDKTAAPETPPKDEALQKDELDIAAIVKAAISEAINPVSDRLEKLEKARGTRNSIPEESEVQKKNSIFSGAFVG